MKILKGIYITVAILFTAIATLGIVYVGIFVTLISSIADVDGGKELLLGGLFLMGLANAVLYGIYRGITQYMKYRGNKKGKEPNKDAPENTW